MAALTAALVLVGTAGQPHEDAGSSAASSGAASGPGGLSE